MTEYQRARSGVLTGVVLGAVAASAFGLIMLAGVADVVILWLSPWPVHRTSFVVAGVGFLGAAVFGLSGLSSYRMLRRWQRLNERPVMAWGTLGEPRRTNTKINRMHLYELPVMVTPPQGAPYPALARWFYPSDLRGYVGANARVVVRIDPDDTATVLVDWDQTRAALGLPPSTL
ncbi:MAG: hypothetical protein U0325_28845 [Polyangiales bacterium]